MKTSTSLKKEDKREKILAAATKVFAQKGYPAGKVSDIARQADISYGLVYSYFKNKDDVLMTLFRERWQILIRYIEKVALRKDIPPDIKLQKVGNFLIRSYEREPELMKVLVLYIHPHSNFYEKNIKSLERAFQLIQRIIKEGQQKGVFNKKLDLQIAAQGFYGGVWQIILSWIKNIVPYSPESVRKTYLFVNLFVQGKLGGQSVLKRGKA